MFFVLNKKYQNAKQKRQEFETFYKTYKGQTHALETARHIADNIKMLHE